MDEYHRRLQSLAIALVSLLLMFIACLWLLWLVDPMGGAVPVPLGAGRELDVNFWVAGTGLGVAVWYQDATTNVRLLTGYLPITLWSLVVLAVATVVFIVSIVRQYVRFCA